MDKVFNHKDRVIYKKEPATFIHYCINNDFAMILFDNESDLWSAKVKELMLDAAHLSFAQLIEFMNTHGVTGSTITDLWWATAELQERQLFVEDIFSLLNNIK